MSSWLMSMTRVQRLVVVGEPDPAVQLGIAGQLSVEAGHADEDHAQVAAVEEVAELLEAGGLEAVGLVDDDQFGAAVGVQLVPTGVARRVQCSVDV